MPLTFLQLGGGLQPLPHHPEALLGHHSRVPAEERDGVSLNSLPRGAGVARVATRPPSAHRNCRSFSRRSFPRLDVTSSGTLEKTRSLCGWRLAGHLGSWWAEVGEAASQPPPGSHSRGGDDLVLGSPDQQDRALVPSGQQGELRGRQVTADKWLPPSLPRPTHSKAPG